MDVGPKKKLRQSKDNSIKNCTHLLSPEWPVAFWQGRMNPALRRGVGKKFPTKFTVWTEPGKGEWQCNYPRRASKILHTINWYSELWAIVFARLCPRTLAPLCDSWKFLISREDIPYCPTAPGKCKTWSGKLLQSNDRASTKKLESCSIYAQVVILNIQYTREQNN